MKGDGIAGEMTLIFGAGTVRWVVMAFMDVGKFKVDKI